MADYIEREALLAYLEERRCFLFKENGDYDHYANGFEEAVDKVEGFPPAIEAEPVKHGRWELKHIGHGHYWECSVCHTNPCIYVTKNTNYCPNCGARMDLEEI